MRLIENIQDLSIDCSVASIDRTACLELGFDKEIPASWVSELGAQLGAYIIGKNEIGENSSGMLVRCSNINNISSMLSIESLKIETTLLHVSESGLAQFNSKMSDGKLKILCSFSVLLTEIK